STIPMVVTGGRGGGVDRFGSGQYRTRRRRIVEIDHWFLDRLHPSAISGWQWAADQGGGQLAAQCQHQRGVGAECELYSQHGGGKKHRAEVYIEIQFRF